MGSPICHAATRMTDAPDGKRDFFVSFNQADRMLAEWIAYVLEENRYSVWFQHWDFRHNWVARELCWNLGDAVIRRRSVLAF